MESRANGHRRAGGHTCAKRRRPDLTLSQHFSSAAAAATAGVLIVQDKLYMQVAPDGVRWPLILIATASN